MKSFYLGLLILFNSLSFDCKAEVNIVVSKLLCNNSENPAIINSSTPQFSWQLKSEFRNQSQSAYHILVADNLDDIQNSRGNIWDSEKVISYKSVPVLGSKQEPANNCAIGVGHIADKIEKLSQI